MDIPEQDRPLVNVVGDRVALGPLRRDLLPVYHIWFNDLVTADRFGEMPRPVTLEQAGVWYDREVAATDRAAFTIYALPDFRPIGLGDLNEIDNRAETAYLSIRIGEPDARGKGHGTEAVHLLLDVAFTALGLHNVMLTVAEYNLAGLRAYKKAGFRDCGRRRQSVVQGDRRWDLVYMDCLRNEVQSPVLGKAFSPDAPRT